MKESLQALCDSFIENRDTIKSAFIWDNGYIYPVCAAIFTDKRQQADADRLKQCRDILKKNAGVFSNFRGNGQLAVITMMALDPDPEDLLQRALQIYDALKEYFFASEYLTLVSMIIANMVEPVRYAEIAARTRHIYNLMREEHPFLTSGEDSVFAALLALSDLTDEQMVHATESCYRILKPQFFSGNAVQALSHVLAMVEGDAEEKCGKTLELFRILKDRGHKYGTGYELATLGVLAMLPDDVAEIADEMIEIDQFLSKQKGYSIVGIGRKQRLMHAGMLVCSHSIGQSGNNTVLQSAAISGTISLIVAQHVAVCAAVAASSTTTTSSR